MKKAWKLLAALPLLTCFLQAASSAVSEIPLAEKSLPRLDAILRNAVQQSPRMVNRALDLEMAANDRIAARAGLLPSVSGSYSYNKSKDSINYISGPASTTAYTNTVTKTPYALSLSQPLFHWGERRNNNRIGKIQFQIAQGQYREGYRLLAQELRGGYMRLIVQKLAVKRARFYHQFISNQLKLQEERLIKKVISEVEISIARQKAEQAQISLERSEFDFANAKESFARLAGLSSMTDESIPDSIPETSYSVAHFEPLLAEFLAQKEPVSVEAFNLRKEIDIQNLNYANVKTRLRPKVNANIALSQDEQNNIYGPGTKYSTASRYAGISINWTIFDGFAANMATRNALIRRRVLENNYHQLTEQLAQDAQAAAKQVYFSARSMSIQDRLLTSNLGYLSTMREDFRRGVKSDSDVSQVQLNVYDAEVDVANARADFLAKAGDFLGVLNVDPIVSNLPSK